MLLDTHIFLWWDSAPEKLPPAYRKLCENPATIMHLSVASVWEMQIKLQSGKLRLSQPLGAMLDRQRTVNGIQIMAIELRHVLALAALPDIHKDPFDRMLIAQATSEGLPLLSVDNVFDQYPVQRLPFD